MVFEHHWGLKNRGPGVSAAVAGRSDQRPVPLASDSSRATSEDYGMTHTGATWDWKPRTLTVTFHGASQTPTPEASMVLAI